MRTYTQVSPVNLQKSRGVSFIGLDYPEAVGGGDLGVMENVLVIEEFCKADSGMGMAIHLAYLPCKDTQDLWHTGAAQKIPVAPLQRGLGLCSLIH